MKNRFFTALLFLGFFGFAACSHQTPNLQGFWEGTIEIKGMKLRLVLKVTQTTDGKLAATVDSIDQNAKDLSVSSMVLEKDAVRMELKNLGAAFEGNLNSSKTEMIGVWKQGGGNIPLTFKRTNAPSKIQEARPDADYVKSQTSELPGYWTGKLVAEKIELRLALKIAEGPGGTFAAVIDSIDQGGKNLPASAVSYTKPEARIEFAGIGGKFEGKLNADGTELSGLWTQFSKTNSLTFKRGEPPSANESEKNYLHVNENDLQGFWKGTLDVQTTKLRLALKIAKAPDGSFHGTMDSIDQGAKNLPASAVTYNEPTVKMEWKGIGGIYEGKMEKGQMIGTWTQGPGSYPLTFTRSAESDLAK